MKLFQKIKKRKEERKRIEWNDISIKQFMEISKVDKDSEDSIYEYLAIIHRTTVDDIMSRPISEVMAMTDDLKFLQNVPKRDFKPQPTYTVNGTEYVVLLDPNDMTTAQYIDFQMLDSDYENHIPELLSIMLVPKDKKYNEGYKVEKVKEELYDGMSVTDAITLTSFFSVWSSISTRLMLVRLTRELKRKRREAPTPEVKEKITEALGHLKTYKKNVRKLL